MLNAAEADYPRLRRHSCPVRKNLSAVVDRGVLFSAVDASIWGSGALDLPAGAWICCLAGQRRVWLAAARGDGVCYGKYAEKLPGSACADGEDIVGRHTGDAAAAKSSR